MHDAERGLFELSRGRPLFLRAGKGAGLVAAVETLSVQALETVRTAGAGPLRLVITAYRARSMGLLPGSHNGENAALSLRLPEDVSVEEIVGLATSRGENPPLDVEPRPTDPVEESGLNLARSGRLLPAIVSMPASLTGEGELDELLRAGTILQVTSDVVSRFTQASSEILVPVSEAPVPLAEAGDARFTLFREGNGLHEHLAVTVGSRDGWPDPVPLRIHSACVTGDLFGSLRCDCGEQLRESIRVFSELGGGVLLYMAHEGRSIGLANKLRAYAIQEEGLDTVDADCALGFGADERSYGPAISILRALEVHRVRILTNNPLKVRALEEGGVQVVDRLPLHGSLNAHNLPYLSAKRLRSGHLIDGMLSRKLPDP